MAEANNIRAEWVTLSADGSPMEGWLARPGGDGAWPGVLVFMEIFGVNSHIRDVTERVAREGYVALAVNYYHRTTPNLELGYDDRSVVTGRSHKMKTTREGILKDIKTSLDYLKARPDVSPKDRFGCIGFCFGGHVAYIAATLPEMAATASFYGAGIATTSPGDGAPTVTHTNEIGGEILCLFGERDPLIPAADVDVVGNALKSAGTRHEVVRYPQAGHGFFCDRRADYDPEAAADAWRRVTALFAGNLR